MLKIIDEQIPKLSSLAAVEAAKNGSFENEKGFIGLSITDKEIETIRIDEQFEQLEWLSIVGCKSLKHIEITIPLSKLKSICITRCAVKHFNLESAPVLKRLMLIKNKLERCVLRGVYPELILLDVSQNKISDFIFPAEFLKLRAFYFYSNQLNSFTLPYCPNLEDLQGQENQLNQIPEELLNEKLFPKLDSIYFHNNPTNDIQNVIFSKNENNQKERFLDWVKELRSVPFEKNKVIRLMILGNGQVGKSSLLEAFKSKDNKAKEGLDSTDGVKLDVFEYEGVVFHVWDFAGQEVFHGTHRLFINKNSIYALVSSDAIEDKAARFEKSEDPITKERIDNHPIQYWFDSILKKNQKYKPLLVQNKVDKARGINEHLSSFAEKNELNFIQSSAIKGTNVLLIKDQLTAAAKKTINYGLELPPSWVAIRNWLTENNQENTKRILKKEPIVSVLTYDKYQSYCGECKVNPSVQYLLDEYLEQNGYLFFTNNKQSVIIDLNWALEAIYLPFSRKSTPYERFEKEKGMVFKSELMEFFDHAEKKYSDWEKEVFVDFMLHSKMCFKIEDDNRAANPLIVFPFFLGKDLPTEVNNYWKEKPKRLFRYKMAWNNYYLIQSFIAKMGNKAKNNNIWKNGIHVYIKHEGAFTVELVQEKEKKACYIDCTISPNLVNSWFKDINEKIGNFDWLEVFENEKEEKLDLPRIEKSNEKKLESIPNQNKPEILIFFAANPLSEDEGEKELTSKINYEKEYTRISKIVQNVNNLSPRIEDDITIEMFNDILWEKKPDYIHFVCHGFTYKYLREKSCLIMQDENRGLEKYFKKDLIDDLNYAVKNKGLSNLKLVVLNACHSSDIALAIQEKVGVKAIGCNEVVTSEVGIKFSKNFYKRLFINNCFKEAFNDAKHISKSTVFEYYE